jgi:hypothetical protein
MLGVMQKNDLKALILMGDTNVGYGFLGDFRYCQDNRVIFHRQGWDMGTLVTTVTNLSFHL